MEGSVLRNHSHDALSPTPEIPVEIVRRISEKATTSGNGSEKYPLAKIAMDAVFKEVSTSLKGLSDSVAKQKLEQFGLNELFKPPMPGIITLFCLQLLNFVIMLLIAAACASIVVTATSDNRDNALEYSTGIAIYLLVIVNAGIAAKVESQANGALDALKKLSQAAVTVIRDNNEVKVPTNLIVPGDIVNLAVGDVVPADVRLIDSADFKVNEMPLTGEPDDVAKTHKVRPAKDGEVAKLRPETMAFSGCQVTNGKAQCVVVGTGMNTDIGQIAAMLNDGGESAASAGNGEDGETDKPKNKSCLPQSGNTKTPMQTSLDKLGARIGIGACIVCAVVWVIGFAQEAVSYEDLEKTGQERMTASALYMVLISVTLAVAAIPEGIPLCVTISLSLGCVDMKTRNVLVKQLAAVETLGCASVICTDKTGTLTEGKMTMVKMWSANTLYEVEGKGFDPTIGGIKTKDGGQDAAQNKCVRSTLFSALCCCSTKLIQNEEKRWEPQGNSSEAPIVVAARKIGMNEQQIDKDYERVMEVPFSSARKMMLTVTKMPSPQLGKGGHALPSDKKLLSVCKGAPNFILNACEGYLTEDGSFEPLTQEKKAEILQVVDSFSSEALRVLAIGVSPMAELPYDPNDEEVQTDDKFKLCREGLQLLGLVASKDPERNGVPEAVVVARGASVRVVMITGDYLKTAVAIGHKCKILQEGDDDEKDAVDCGSLRPGGPYLSNDEIDQITARVKVFARAQPEDKLEIVKSLQRQDFVSAMTGDGVNDAPALKQANIGVGMGLCGTEVAKGAADMILMDDNFATIVTAVEKGRAIYAGIQKFVAFIMSVHIAEVLQIFLCVLCEMPTIRTPLQILFLILVTDLPPSIALGQEPGEPNILKLKPRPKKEPIILGWMWISIFMNGFILAGVILGIYSFSLYHFIGAISYSEIITETNRRENAFIAAGMTQQAASDEADKEMKMGLMCAQTVAFIALVFSENIRAYIARSFDRPFWQNFLANKAMQKAVAMADVVLLVAVLVPGLSDKILGLDGISIGIVGWIVSLLGPMLTVILCEAFKVVTHFQIERYQGALDRKLREEETARKQVLTLEVLERRTQLMTEQWTNAQNEIAALKRAQKEKEHLEKRRSVRIDSTASTSNKPQSPPPAVATPKSGECFMSCIPNK
jgi:potassium/sodium efflux P-type ATPase